MEKTLVNRLIEYFNHEFTHDQDGDRINFHIKTEEEIGVHFVLYHQYIGFD